LAAYTSIRGEPPASTTGISQTGHPDLSTVSANGFIVFDLGSGQILLEKNGNTKFKIASLTKLMTGLVAYQNINLNQSLTIGQNDRLNIAPDLGLIPGDNILASDLFNAMLIGSCNDAALALGNRIAAITGTDFVVLMNREAQSLGMTNSHFSNPMGFDSVNNYSTAEDLKLLVSRAEQLSAYTNLGRRESYAFSGSQGKKYFAVATNRLIKSHPELDAIKTGYTTLAGGAMASKLQVNGHGVVILVLDSQNRENDTLKLEQDVLNNFNWE
jgi:D-alanyl-D-alanine carboxypeptidase